jgi:small subunit ribosomal protein S6
MPRPFFDRYSRPPPVSTATTMEYELVLMLDPEIPEERREQIASEARQRIESGGSLKHDTAWGMRKLAYEIRQRTEADYRFFRFETGGELLDDLNHNLRIADGVLRFRIFKVDPRLPAIVPPPPLAMSAPAQSRGPRRQGGGGRGARAAADEAPAPPAAEEAPAEDAPAAPAAQEVAPTEEAPAAPTEEAPAAPAEEVPATPAEEAPPEEPPAAPQEAEAGDAEPEQPSEPEPT